MMSYRRESSINLSEVKKGIREARVLDQYEADLESNQTPGG